MTENTTRTLVQAACVILLLALGVFGAVALVQTKPQARQQDVPVPIPLVRVLRVMPETFTVTVESQGSVLPHTDTQLAAEVTGKIVETAPSLAAGGFFEAGDVLVRIDDTDYRTDVERAAAEVAQAELVLAREQAEAASARREWTEVGEGEAPPLVVRAPQLAQAQAALRAAQAGLTQAKVNLARTEIRAPFAGRVWEERVDVGQFVMRGATVARVYAIDFAEVRLPIPTDELGFVDLPIALRDQNAANPPPVALRAMLGGRLWTWDGSIVRTAGEIDPRSGMLHAVARVDDPYGPQQDGNGESMRPPLPVGLFVQAAIRGHTFTDVVVLPRSALRDESTVLVVDDGDRLHPRPVEVLRRERERVVVRAGLAAGERVCLTALAIVTDGMLVRAVEEPSDGPPPADGR